MSTIVLDENVVHIPSGVDNLTSFRRWVRTDDFPQAGRIGFIHGEVWVDMSKEQFFSHNQVKNEFAYVLTNLVKQHKLGRYVADGMLLTNLEANLSTRPDGAFVSQEALRTGKVVLVEGEAEGFLELQGSPEMVLEVVSPSTVKKDTVWLREQYWQADILEYWLVDARGDGLSFDILRQNSKGYVATRKQGGWLRSEVFAHSFRLTRGTDELGHPTYDLLVK